MLVKPKVWRMIVQSILGVFVALGVSLLFEYILRGEVARHPWSYLGIMLVTGPAAYLYSTSKYEISLHGEWISGPGSFGRVEMSLDDVSLRAFQEPSWWNRLNRQVVLVSSAASASRSATGSKIILNRSFYDPDDLQRLEAAIAIGDRSIFGK